MQFKITPPRYQFDPTGISKNNFIANELHVIPPESKRIIALKGGSFYANSVTITHGHETLELGKDYDFTSLYQDATIATGKDVYVLIYFVNPDFNGEVNVTYQCVGGEYTGIWETIQDYINILTVDPRHIYWDDILKKPRKFVPVEHYHDVDDIYGLNILAVKLEELRVVLSNVRGKEMTKVYGYMMRTRQMVQEQVDDITTSKISLKDFRAKLDSYDKTLAIMQKEIDNLNNFGTTGGGNDITKKIIKIVIDQVTDSINDICKVSNASFEARIKKIEDTFASLDEIIKQTKELQDQLQLNDSKQTEDIEDLNKKTDKTNLHLTHLRQDFDDMVNNRDNYIQLRIDNSLAPINEKLKTGDRLFKELNEQFDDLKRRNDMVIDKNDRMVSQDVFSAYQLATSKKIDLLQLNDTQHDKRFNNQDKTIDDITNKIQELTKISSKYGRQLIEQNTQILDVKRYFETIEPNLGLIGNLNTVYKQIEDLNKIPKELRDPTYNDHLVSKMSSMDSRIRTNEVNIDAIRDSIKNHNAINKTTIDAITNEAKSTNNSLHALTVTINNIKSNTKEIEDKVDTFTNKILEFDTDNKKIKEELRSLVSKDINMINTRLDKLESQISQILDTIKTK